ncbi:MAG: hypothetical protein HY046_12090 [Acidobacteria bacterium]|nr:hypothetical protein [Acidobacteriota bacterium]
MISKRILGMYGAAFLTATVYDFVVYGILLKPINGAHPELLKTQTDLPVGLMLLTSVVLWAAVTAVYLWYAQSGHTGVLAGIVFGLVMGLIVGWIPQQTNYLLLLTWPFYVAWGAAAWCEYVVVGIVLSLIYKP